MSGASGWSNWRRGEHRAADRVSAPPCLQPWLSGTLRSLCLLFFFPQPPSEGGCPACPGHLITYNSDVVQPLQIDLTSSPAHNWPKYWYFPGSMATVVQWPLWSPKHPPHVHISSFSVRKQPAILGTDEWSPDNKLRATNGNKSKSIGGNSCLLLGRPFWSINDKYFTAVPL